MIVETMTYKEMSKEFIEDYEKFMSYWVHKIMKNFVKSQFHHKQYYNLDIGDTEKYVSNDNKNTYEVFGVGDRCRHRVNCVFYKRVYKNDKVMYLVGRLSDTINGKCVYTMEIYDRHFIERYAERTNIIIPTNMDMDIGKIVISQFLLKNNECSFVNLLSISPRHRENSFYAVCDNGLSICIYDDFVHRKTFISNTMLKHSDEVLIRQYGDIVSRVLGKHKTLSPQELYTLFNSDAYIEHIMCSYSSFDDFYNFMKKHTHKYLECLISMCPNYMDMIKEKLNNRPQIYRNIAKMFYDYSTLS